MRRSYKQSLVMLSLVVGVGWTPFETQAVPPQDEFVTIYLVRFGWHADIVLPVERCGPLPQEAPEPLLRANHVAIGWGDATYFPVEDPEVIDLLRAAVVPSSSVLLVRTINRPVESVFVRHELMPLRITAAACEQIGSFIRQRFAVEDSSLVHVPTDRKIAATFFLSTDRYHVLHNCNHWVAEALRAGGLRIRPARTPTVGLLWRAAQRLPQASQPE